MTIMRGGTTIDLTTITTATMSDLITMTTSTIQVERRTDTEECTDTGNSWSRLSLDRMLSHKIMAMMITASSAMMLTIPTGTEVNSNITCTALKMWTVITRYLCTGLRMTGTTIMDTITTTQISCFSEIESEFTNKHLSNWSDLYRLNLKVWLIDLCFTFMMMSIYFI